MENYLRKIRTAVLSVGLLAGAACNDKDEVVPPLVIDPVEALPVVQASGNYYGNDKLSCDHYAVYLSDGDAFVEDGAFGGDGVGVCLEFYAPIRSNMEFSKGTYEAHQPIIQSWLYSFEPGSESGGSYIYPGSASAVVYIVDGSLKVDRTGTSYRIAGVVKGVDGLNYELNFAGEIPFEDLSPEGPGTDPDVDYIEMPQCYGYYFGDLMTPDNDNYTFNLASEGVEDEGGVFGGYGTGISFDLYAPLGSGVIPPDGVYSAFDEAKDGSLDFRYQPGSDYGGGFLQGSYIWMRATPTSEKEYVYIVGGTLAIAKEADGYTVKVDLVGDDGKSYKYKYVGATLDILDPFGGM